MNQSIFTSSRFKISALLFHVGFWIVFISYEVWTTQNLAGFYTSTLNYILYYGLNLTAFYVSTFWLLPVTFRDRRHTWWRLPLNFVLFFCIFTCISFLNTEISYLRSTSLHAKQPLVDLNFVAGNLWRMSIFLALALGYYFQRELLRVERVKALAEKRILEQKLKERDSAIALSEAKNSLLQAKLNPHFLFSAFMYMKTQSRQISPSFSHAVQLLADIMRYSFKSDQKQNKTLIQEEIEHVEYLIEFWEIIKSSELYLEIDVSKPALHLNFIPLVLITLTENMLKHGDLSNSDAPGSISVKLHKGLLTIKTLNNISNEPSYSGFHSGLDNIRERLMHTYGDAAILKCEMFDGKFSVQILWNR